MSVCPPVRRSFSDERGPGTFHSMGALPKRKHDLAPRKSPVFHIAHDDDDDHAASVAEHVSPSSSAVPTTVPFPRSPSPPSPESASSAPSPVSLRAQLPRGDSVPVLLSNGKPLKSSLKSSSSSPAVMTPTQVQHPHLRSRSEPSSPVATPKNVHFPEKDYGLATVRVYNRSARPAALSNPANGNGDETETEGEDGPPTRFPFSPFSSFHYEVDPTKSSPVPCKIPPANLFLESLNISSPSFSSPSSTPKPLLTGAILVRNLAFEKHVAVRFTLDDWQTVSEVSAHYVDSSSSLPTILPSSPPSGNSSPHRGRGWDRFTFTIRLEDYAHTLSTRTLWLAVRYRTSSTYPNPGSAKYGPGGEWWDNNDDANYRVGFRPALATPPPPRGRPRRETVAAPIPSSRACPPAPPTRKDHPLGLIPSVPQTREVQHVQETDRRSTPMRAGRLNLCNYAPPTIRVTPCNSFHPGSSQASLQPSIPNPESLSPETQQAPSNEDSASPASSTLSTPSVSPTIAPRVIIGGQPATQLPDLVEDEAITPSRPSHIEDWEWSAPNKLRIGKVPCQRDGTTPILEVPLRRRDISFSSGRNTLADSNSLYNAFVTQWCFAQGSSSSHNAYGDVGIMT